MPHKQISNNTDEISKFSKWFRTEYLENISKDKTKCDFSEYIILELLNNAYEHGNEKDETKFINLEWSVLGGSISFSVEDQGNGFSPEIPTEVPPVEVPRGRGLWTVSLYADSLLFNAKGNKITVNLS